MQVRLFLRCLFAVSLLNLTVLPLQADQLPLDHPCAVLVKKYLTAVVQQDWKTASQMLVPASLERRQRETVNIIKNAPTMTDEENMLAGYNVKGVSDLDKMSPQEFYQVDREAWHKKLKLT